MKLRWLMLSALLVVLLVPAGLITVARLFDMPGGTWVRLVAFTPYAGVLYAVALPPLLWVAWRGRGLARGAAQGLAVVAVLGLLLHAYWASCPFLGSSTAEASARGHLRVMTSNLRLGQADASEVVGVAVDRDVDVLVLEEVTPRALVGLRTAEIRRAFDYSAGHAEPGPGGTMVFSTHPLRNVQRLDTAFGSYVMDVRLPRGSVHLLAVHPRPPIGHATAWLTDLSAGPEAARGRPGRTAIVGELRPARGHPAVR